MEERVEDDGGAEALCRVDADPSRLEARAHHLERCARVGDEQSAEVLEQAALESATRAPAVSARWLAAALIAISPFAIFYGVGLGLYGKVGPALLVVLSVSIIAGQAVASRWWLRRFRFGPAEWVWRSLTYGRPQPMRLRSGELPVAEAAA